MFKLQRFFANNVTRSTRLMETQQAGVRRLVFSSTCAVYEPPEWVPAGRTPRPPESPYGESNMIERAQSGTTAARGLRSVSLRYFNTAGVGRRVDPEDWTVTINLDRYSLWRSSLGLCGPLEIFGTDYPTPVRERDPRLRS